MIQNLQICHPFAGPLYRCLRALAARPGPIGAGIIDVLLALAILWVLVGEAAPPFTAFVAAYAIACVIGLASFSPGGLGVFEAALVVALPTAAPEALAAGMIGYRLVVVVLVLIANQLLGHPPSAPCCSRRATWRATASSCAASRPWKTSAASSSAPTRPAP